MTLRGDSGQSVTEVAISLMLLVSFSMAAMDFGYLFSQKLTLQNAVRQAGRYAITVQCVTGSNGSCSITRYNSSRSDAPEYVARLSEHLEYRRRKYDVHKRGRWMSQQCRRTWRSGHDLRFLPLHIFKSDVGGVIPESCIHDQGWRFLYERIVPTECQLGGV